MLCDEINTYCATTRNSSSSSSSADKSPVEDKVTTNKSTAHESPPSTIKTSLKKRKHAGSESSLIDSEVLPSTTLSLDPSLGVVESSALKERGSEVGTAVVVADDGSSNVAVKLVRATLDDQSSSSGLSNEHAGSPTDTLGGHDFISGNNANHYWTAANAGCCPNVTLLPPSRLHSPNSSSGLTHGWSGSARSAFSNTSVTPPLAKVLVVSHGGLITELLSHFVDELGCRLPSSSGRRAAHRITPNAALSCFNIHRVPGAENSGGLAGGGAKEVGAMKIECLLIHDKVHLMGMAGDAAPLSTNDDCIETMLNLAGYEHCS